MMNCKACGTPLDKKNADPSGEYCKKCAASMATDEHENKVRESIQDFWATKSSPARESSSE
jgi:predicted amidophosphoribosyltransferase